MSAWLVGSAVVSTWAAIWLGLILRRETYHPDEPETQTRGRWVARVFLLALIFVAVFCWAQLAGAHA